MNISFKIKIEDTKVNGLVPRNAFDLKLVTQFFLFNDLNYIYKEHIRKIFKFYQEVVKRQE